MNPATTSVHPSIETPAEPVLEVVASLHELAEAGHQLAAASEVLINARSRHQEAQARYSHLLDQAAKLREQYGV